MSGPAANETLEFEQEATAKTSAEVRALLRRKFPADQFAMLYEVRDAAGFGATRSADVFMIGLWPSRGCLIEGMEIKVSRSDWLQELKKPQKAEAFVPYCDKWWVVVGSKDIVKPAELPPNWGLMVAGGRGLSVVTDAPRLESKPLDKSLLAALLKRATSTTLTDPEVAAVIAAQVKVEKEKFTASQSYDLTHAKRQVTELQEAIKAFEEASGVRIEQYRAGQIGNAVKTVINMEHRSMITQAKSLRDYIRRLADRMDQDFPDEGSSTTDTEGAK